MEQRIITPEDIREFYPNVSVNIDDESINPFILLAQQNDLENFLGPYLYASFIEDYDGDNFATQIYIDLFKGKVYTESGKSRYYRGIRQLLALYSVVRIIEQSDFYLTDTGMVQKITDESESKEDSQVRSIMAKVRDDAIRLEADTKTFIEANSSDYPDFNKIYSTDTSFKFRKVNANPKYTNYG